ncbi:hypothetical protein [Brachybacterium phenoliresistens]|uniref:hypothetical protein n=1 Tax=Brachybacterium phenoliresistens TaxID=396014 RepID=UPI0031E0AA3E
MKIRDRDLLIQYMEDRDFSQARLGRYAGVSRQFIHKLTSGETRTCSQRVGTLIEEGLAVLPGTLFVPEKSCVGRESVASGASTSEGKHEAPRPRRAAAHRTTTTKAAA